MARATILGLVFAAAAALPAAAQGLPPTGFEVGERFPVDLSLTDAESGRPSSLAAYRGKKVLLIVYASW